MWLHIEVGDRLYGILLRLKLVSLYGSSLLKYVFHRKIIFKRIIAGLKLRSQSTHHGIIYWLVCKLFRDAFKLWKLSYFRIIVCGELERNGQETILLV